MGLRVLGLGYDDERIRVGPGGRGGSPLGCDLGWRAWMRDDDGWYRVAGSWSPRNAARADTVRVRTDDWRISGPPDDRPDENPGPAPGPNLFYVPGHYTPGGNRLVWTPGYWAEAQPGWDWVPARWVRLAEGWTFRKGYSDTRSRCEKRRPSQRGTSRLSRLAPRNCGFRTERSRRRPGSASDPPTP